MTIASVVLRTVDAPVQKYLWGLLMDQLFFHDFKGIYIHFPGLRACAKLRKIIIHMMDVWDIDSVFRNSNPNLSDTNFFQETKNHFSIQAIYLHVLNCIN